GPRNGPRRHRPRKTAEALFPLESIMIARLFRMFFAPRKPAAPPARKEGVVCPICGEGAAPTLFDATREQRGFICPECRHLFWDRVPSPEELQRFYENEYCETHNQPATQESIRAYYRGHVEELLAAVGRRREEICLVDYGSSIPTLVREARDAG